MLCPLYQGICIVIKDIGRHLSLHNLKIAYNNVSLNLGNNGFVSLHDQRTLILPC